MNRSILVVIVIAASSGGASAQPIDAGVLDTPPVPACTGTLDGHLVDVTTHDPVAAATVTVGDQLLAQSDDSGRFTLTTVCPGESTLVIERSDYESATRTITQGQHAIEIELKALGETIEIKAKAPPPTEMRSTAEISGAKLERTRGRSFSNALADVPGVSELRSATGVAKPIIRGQFGRRLLILVDGIRHRSQEWGLEHAPEIDPFMADKIRVVRGAGGVRYGSDAIGGVVLVDPPELRWEPGYNGEAHLIGASNGRGGTLAGRAQAAFDRAPGLSFQLEGSVKRLAAPETPDYALDNSGLFDWAVGATVGYRTKTPSTSCRTGAIRRGSGCARACASTTSATFSRRPSSVSHSARTDESDMHLLLFTGTAVVGPASPTTTGPLTQSYGDTDVNGFPIGLTNMVVAAAGTGTLTVTLRHMPPEEPPVKAASTPMLAKTGGIDSIGGSTDVQVNFSVTVP